MKLRSHILNHSVGRSIVAAGLLVAGVAGTARAQAPAELVTDIGTSTFGSSPANAVAANRSSSASDSSPLSDPLWARTAPTKTARSWLLGPRWSGPSLPERRVRRLGSESGGLDFTG